MAGADESVLEISHTLRWTDVSGLHPLERPQPGLGLGPIFAWMSGRELRVVNLSLRARSFDLAMRYRNVCEDQIIVLSRGESYLECFPVRYADLAIAQDLRLRFVTAASAEPLCIGVARTSSTPDRELGLMIEWIDLV